MGNKIFEFHEFDKTPNDEIVINTSGIHPGTYLLRVRVDNQLLSRKIYKVH